MPRRTTRKPNQFERLHERANAPREAVIASANHNYLQSILGGLASMISEAAPQYRHITYKHNEEPTVSFTSLGHTPDMSFRLSYLRTDGSTVIYQLKDYGLDKTKAPDSPITLVPMEDGNLSPRTIEEMACVMAKALGVNLLAQVKQPTPPAETMVVAGGVVANAPHP
jgi:hypothetical protein